VKFGRRYKLSVQVKDDLFGADSFIAIEYPLTLELDVSRNIMASANKGTFKIYNLREEWRNQIFHDWRDYEKHYYVKLEAGYLSEPFLPTIFAGQIASASSERVGVNWITTIEANDGMQAISDGFANQSLGAGVSFRQFLTTCIGSMSGVQIGELATVPDVERPRGVSLYGNPWEIIQNNIPQGHAAFIDNGLINFVKLNQHTKNLTVEIPLLSADTGNVGTPKKYQARIDLTRIFDPTRKPGQIVNLESSLTRYNGLYTVQGVAHRGVISGAAAGDLKTILNLYNKSMVEPIS